MPKLFKNYRRARASAMRGSATEFNKRAFQFYFCNPGMRSIRTNRIVDLRSNSGMSDNFLSLVKQHHAFYQVSPYYVLLDERPLGLPATTRRVQAGFNVDVFGIRTEDHELAMPSPQEYALGYAELRKLAESVSQHATNSCSVEAIAFPSTAIIDTRNRGQVEAVIRIHISHERGLKQPAGLPEQRALDEVEGELKKLGIVHR